jgi:hypothetical protein
MTDKLIEIVQYTKRTDHINIMKRTYINDNTIRFQYSVVSIPGVGTLDGFTASELVIICGKILHENRIFSIFWYIQKSAYGNQPTPLQVKFSTIPDVSLYSIFCNRISENLVWAATIHPIWQLQLFAERIALAVVFHSTRKFHQLTKSLNFLQKTLVSVLDSTHQTIKTL